MSLVEPTCKLRVSIICATDRTYFLCEVLDAGGIPTTSMVPCSLSSGAPSTSGRWRTFLLRDWWGEHTTQ